MRIRRGRRPKDEESKTPPRSGIGVTPAQSGPIPSGNSKRSETHKAGGARPTSNKVGGGWLASFLGGEKKAAAPEVVGAAALHSAAMKGSIPALQSVLLKGVGINARDTGGRAALHMVAETGDLDTAEFLLTKGANPSVRDLDGKTPLHIAVKARDVEMISLLLARGAEADARDQTGHAPLHVAVTSGDADSVEMLLSHGADANVRDNNGRTPLRVAEVQGRRGMAGIIRRYGGMNG